MTLAKYSVVLLASFSITAVGIVAAQESPAKTASKVVQEPFQATSIRSSADRIIGPYRWHVWQVHSITPIGENTSFQEVQVIVP